MSRMVALSGPALADGLRLTGVSTLTVRSGDEARDALRPLLDDPDVGLVLVTTDLWQALDERARERLEALARPIVLPIPGGAGSDLVTRRELVADMLRRAIGYRIHIGGARG